MNLADERLKGLDDPALTEDRRAVLRCEVAADLMYAGQYEAAREALGELWPGIGDRPDVKRLSPVVAAEVLLQCGVLTGWLGSVRNVSGTQERAKDLLFEALRKFKSQGRVSKVSEAQYELGICYWRIGSYDEARVVMREALKPLGDEDAELKAKILIRLAGAEVWQNRYDESLDILREAEPIFESANDAIKGRWHGHRGTVFLWLAGTGRSDYADRAIIEFTAAIYHYEQAGHERYCALNLNNLAFVLYRLGRYRDAHEYLDRARATFTKLQDPGNVAQVDETRARVLVAEQRYADAERLIQDVIRAFERGGELALLADALTVQGIALARLGEHERSLYALRRAVQIAHDAGAQTTTARASLTLVEEHGADRLQESELVRLYLRADDLLRDTQDVEDVARLRECARVVFGQLSGTHLPVGSFSLTEAKYDLEARYIEHALEETGGSVSRAAKLLGMEHQSLIHLPIWVPNVKTGRSYQIPMSTQVREIMLELRRAGNGSEHVFANPKTGKPYTELRRPFESACREAGIKGLRWHDLRHTFGTRLAEAGHSEATIAELMGHTDPKTTRRYTHGTERAKRAAVEATSLRGADDVGRRAELALVAR